MSSDLQGTRVLVTDGEQRAALAVVRSLGRLGCEVHVCATRSISLAGASRFVHASGVVPDPQAHANEFVDKLAEHVRTWGVEVVIPVAEVSILPVLRNSHRFSPALIPFPTYQRFCAVSDKAHVTEVATSIGFAVPSQQRLEVPADAQALDYSQLHFPLVVKPARSVSAGEHAVQRFAPSYAATSNALRSVLATLPGAAYPLLLQERIHGPGGGVFCLRWKGKTVAMFAHRRLREKPPSGGVSVLRESVGLEDQLAQDSRTLLDALDWNGVAMVEIKRDGRTGVPYLMEINPRFWGSLQLAIDAGVDFPGLLLQAAMGQEPQDVANYRIGVRSRWLWGDVDHLAARILHSGDALNLPADAPGRLRVLTDFLVEFWRPGTRSEILRVRDPVPFLVETYRWLRRQST